MEQTAANYTILGSETSFDGVLEFTDNLKINGKFNGTINSNGNLDIDKAAVCTVDKMSASSIVISGSVTGWKHFRHGTRGNVQRQQGQGKRGDRAP